jgi:hypothetical protein
VLDDEHDTHPHPLDEERTMNLHQLLTSAAIILVPAVASADVLLNVNRPIDVKASYDSSVQQWEDRLNYSLLFSPPPELLNDPTLPWLFPDLVLTATDVGKTFTVTASDPNFAANAASMTNGVNDSFYTRGRYFSPNGASGSKAGGANEEFMLFLNDGRPGPDLAGHEVHAVSFTLNSFAVNDYSETILGQTFQGRRFTGDITLTIEGVAIPEPASLLVLPAIGMLMSRRRRI